MIKVKNLLVTLICFGTVSLITSCFQEDPGSIQNGEKEFYASDFTHLKIGSALIINVQQGIEYNITASGDVRNLDDLEVKENGSTLEVKFRNKRRGRKHDTYINITMPVLNGVDFSGASNSVISGFYNTGLVDIDLSGASVATINMSAPAYNITLSGASNLFISGDSASTCDIELSGASNYNAYGLPVDYVKIDASGASNARLYVLEIFDVTASGASSIFYKGNPIIKELDISGASTVQKD